MGRRSSDAPGARARGGHGLPVRSRHSPALPVTKSPKKLGRPLGSSLLNPELEAAICRDLALGIPLKYAAEANGTAEMTVHHWLEKGAAGIEPYAHFREAVTRARAIAVTMLVRKVLAGENGSAQAAWMLERRYPKDFGQRQHLELSGRDGNPIEHDVRIDPVSDAAARALLEAALGRPPQ